MITPDIEGKNNGELMINAILKNNTHETYMKSNQANCYNWIKERISIQKIQRELV